MAAAPLQIDAPLTLGAQVDARAQHPELADQVFLMHDDRSWTYRQYRDESGHRGKHTEPVHEVGPLVGHLHRRSIKRSHPILVDP